MIHIFWPIQQYTTLPRTVDIVDISILKVADTDEPLVRVPVAPSCGQNARFRPQVAVWCRIPRMFLRGHKVQLQHFCLKLTCLWRGPVWELLLQSCTLSSSNMSLKFLAKSGSYFHGAVRRKPGASTGAWKLICFLVPPCNCSCLGCWGDHKR